MRRKKEFCQQNVLSDPYRIRLFPHQRQALDKMNRTQRRQMASLVRAAFDVALKKIQPA